MPGGGDPRRQLGTPLDLLTHEEERRVDPSRGEHLKDGGCALGVRTVIEGERSSRTGGRFHSRSESRSHPRRRKRPGHAESTGRRSRDGCQSSEHVSPPRMRMISHAREWEPRPTRMTSAPQLDTWLPDPAVRVSHGRVSSAAPDDLWRAARATKLSQVGLLGRLIRWRIPGLPPETTFDGLFRDEPFSVLDEADDALVSGLVGRIWTFRRDYPMLGEPEEFRQWSRAGTAKVLFAHWVEPADSGGSLLRSETRVEAFGSQGRIGLASVRPLIRGFQHLVGTDAMAAAIRAAEGRESAHGGRQSARERRPGAAEGP